MRLLPHQIFIMPKLYYTRLRNKAALQSESGMLLYYAPLLRYLRIFTRSLNICVLCTRQKWKRSIFLSQYIHQADLEPADHRRIPITLTVNPSELEELSNRTVHLWRNINSHTEIAEIITVQRKFVQTIRYMKGLLEIFWRSHCFYWKKEV